MDRRTRLLVAPLLVLSCVAGCAALARLPYVLHSESRESVVATVESALCATIEVGAVMIAANLGTLRPLLQRTRGHTHGESGLRLDDEEGLREHVSHRELGLQKQKVTFTTRVVALPSEMAAERQMDSESQASLMGSLRREQGRL